MYPPNSALSYDCAVHLTVDRNGKNFHEFKSFGEALSPTKISEVLHRNSNATTLVADQTVLSCAGFICICFQ